MPAPLVYSCHDKNFTSRYDLITYCLDQDDATTTFNQSQFIIPNLPAYLDMSEKIDPVIATGEWVQNFKDQGKKIVLHFSGGLDSLQALDNMIKAGTPPDYLYILTRNPFDQPDFFCATEMEFTYAMNYAKELISGNSVMKNTKIWHEHLDKKDAEQWFNTDHWLKYTSFFHSLECFAPSKWRPLLPKDQDDKYVFILGGCTPKLHWNNGNLEFYYVDLQLDCIIDQQRQNNRYNYAMDNPQMLQYFCQRLLHIQQDNSVAEKNLDNMTECHGDHSDKRFLSEYHRIIPTMIPQLDKRFSKLLPDLHCIDTDEFDYYTYLHRTGIKAWQFYLEAEFFQPQWLNKYKKTFMLNEALIRQINSFPGKLSQFIKTNITKND